MPLFQNAAILNLHRKLQQFVTQSKSVVIPNASSSPRQDQRMTTPSRPKSVCFNIGSGPDDAAGTSEIIQHKSVLKTSQLAVKAFEGNSFAYALALPEYADSAMCQDAAPKPMNSFAQPMTGFDYGAQPMPSYAQPMNSFDRPMNSFAQPMTGYDYGAQPMTGYDYGAQPMPGYMGGPFTGGTFMNRP